MSSHTLPIGKLDPDLLASLLADGPATDASVLLGPGIGCDVAVVEFGDRYLVAKSDPITFATDELGWYAVHVNANDLACAGARPRWFLATLLLPEGKTDAALIERTFYQIRHACAGIGATLIGGHTEITYGLDRAVIAGHMLGEVARENLVLPTGIRPGDAILITKAIAVEGTSILGREIPARLEQAGCTSAQLREAAQHLYEPGISVAPESEALTAAVRVHAMHDPTEGGAATGLWEMAVAGNVGIDVEVDAIPRLPLCERFCNILGLDPLGLIASGSLLAAVDPADVPAAIRASEAAGIPCTKIAVATDRTGEVRARTTAGWKPLPRFDQDEVARLFTEGD